MADVSVANPPPPREVLVEFLHSLERTVGRWDKIVPVLRGSTLLQHWFGPAARPAADIDLEWFPEAGRSEGYSPPLEHARRLCMCAVTDHEDSPIDFNEDIAVPSDGVNLALWDYATPGARCYTGWRWAERNLEGFLQIDLAEAGSYDLAAIATETLELPREFGEPALVLAYTQEMLLAAKLSWIVRNVRRNRTAAGQADIDFHQGEPKDLFDAHLLLTKGTIRPDVFQSAFLAVALEDKLDWMQIDLLLDDSLAVPEDHLPRNWTDFAHRHANLIQQSPAEMLRTVIANLRPHLGDVRQHLPFLEAIQADLMNEANLLIYADWLEERGDARADFLRLFCKFFFHADPAARAQAAAALSAQPVSWLYQVFGGPERSRGLLKRLELKVDSYEAPPGSLPPLTSQPSSQPSAQQKPWWHFW